MRQATGKLHEFSSWISSMAEVRPARDRQAVLSLSEYEVVPVVV